MQITSTVETAAEFESYDDAALFATIFEARHGYDTRVDSTADGYIIRILDDEGDQIGWIENGTVDATPKEIERYSHA